MTTQQKITEANTIINAALVRNIKLDNDGKIIVVVDKVIEAAMDKICNDPSVLGNEYGLYLKAEFKEGDNVEVARWSVRAGGGR